MSERVHVFDLKERTSAKGTRYLSGWLGKASVVAFLDREAAEPTWQVFVSTPAPRESRSTTSTRTVTNRSPFEPQKRPGRNAVKSTLAPGELDDPVDDL